MDYHCYIENCTGDYFAECDECGSEGCATHIAITSKFDQPFLYLCHSCLDEKRAELKEVYPPFQPIAQPTSEEQERAKETLRQYMQKYPTWE